MSGCGPIESVRWYTINHSGKHVTKHKIACDKISVKEIETEKEMKREIGSDGTALIPWEGKAITVDQANKVYLEYFSEGGPRAAEIQALIAAAKTYIRELYPEE